MKYYRKPKKIYRYGIFERFFIIVLILFVATMVFLWYGCYTLKGDLNRNCKLSVTDLVQLSLLEEANKYDSRGDMNDDGKLDKTDHCILSHILAGFKKGEFVCP